MNTMISYQDALGIIGHKGMTKKQKIAKLDKQYYTPLKNWLSSAPAEYLAWEATQNMLKEVSEIDKRIVKL